MEGVESNQHRASLGRPERKGAYAAWIDATLIPGYQAPRKAFWRVSTCCMRQA